MPDRPARPRRLLPMYLRALRLRCPACGGRPMFLSWVRMCPNCPSCGLHFDREPEGGYWVGSYTINLMFTEAVFAGGFVLAVILTWPNPPWDALLLADAALMVICPILFFPWSKALFLAIDLTFRPDEPGDFEEPREAALKPRSV